MLARIFRQSVCWTGGAVMSVLTDKLRALAEAQKGTDLGGLLQWAAMHIESLEETLDDARQFWAEEEAERIRLERTLHEAKLQIEGVIELLSKSICPPIDFAKDMARTSI